MTASSPSSSSAPSQPPPRQCETTGSNKDNDEVFDVCILGSGPAGLTALSAVMEPFALDTLSDVQLTRALKHLKSNKPKVCVVDPHAQWLADWQDNFDTLDICHLRSPALAHCDTWDRNALLSYAVQTDRFQELLESGCSDIAKLHALGQTQIGLWALPSNQLFLDFCRHDLVPRLKHTYVQAKVVDIEEEVFDNNNDDQQQVIFQVQLNTGQCLRAKAVILAMGAAGRLVIPKSLAKLEQALEEEVHQENPPLMVPWYKLNEISDNTKTKKRILVLGGGLTAVQAALKLHKKQGQHQVVLCSRRPLVCRHFDVGLKWLDDRTGSRQLFDFYHCPKQERLHILKEARNGGSVPPWYLKQLKEASAAGGMELVVGEVKANPEIVVQTKNDGPQGGGPLRAVKVQFSCTNSATTTTNTVQTTFDHVVLACGVQPDCRQNPLVTKLLKRWPMPTQGGYLDLTQDLQWNDDKPIFCVGALSALATGPDAGNLMGARRAAQIVANNGLPAHCGRSWLRHDANGQSSTGEGVLVNRFDAFLSDSDDDDDSDCSSSDDDSDSEDEP